MNLRKSSLSHVHIRFYTMNYYFLSIDSSFSNVWNVTRTMAKNSLRIMISKWRETLQCAVCTHDFIFFLSLSCNAGHSIQLLDQCEVYFTGFLIFVTHLCKFLSVLLTTWNLTQRLTVKLNSNSSFKNVTFWLRKVGS